MYDLFSEIDDPNRQERQIKLGAWLFPKELDELQVNTCLSLIEQLIRVSPFRKMQTPMGLMSVSLTSCGKVGWYSDTGGYQYQHLDPLTHKAWPELPSFLCDLAGELALKAGYKDFEPDTCLINEYVIGSSMGLHQDKNEQNFEEPVVSISLGLPATFLFGGAMRNAAIEKIRLEHGDVLVWGGESRLDFHGIEKIMHGEHDQVGARRINITFRRAL